jgi:peptidoglycan/xylan/chitin deacetylase (PgdA/CDA1 family)
MRRPGWLALAASATALLLLSGCASRAPEAPAPAAAAAPAATPATAARALPAGARPGALGEVAGRGERVLVYLPAEGDTPAAVAARLLGSSERAWQIVQANPQLELPPPAGATGLARHRLRADSPWVVPLAAINPTGVSADSVQTVPILCYHRFGSGSSKMIVSPATFEAQLEWLQRNGWRVLRLAELADFLAGKAAVPAKSVVITIDDGYESVYRHAWPLLKKYGFPATLFVYSDFIGARDGLSWAQLQEMASSGVMDIQSHSKSHRNLIERRPGESDAAYRAAIEAEVRQPRQLLERRLQGVKVTHFAYPFGDANELVLENLGKADHDLGVTVNPGGNPFYAQPLMLRRTMIFGDHDLDDFKARLQVRRSVARPQ